MHPAAAAGRRAGAPAAAGASGCDSNRRPAGRAGPAASAWPYEPADQGECPDVPGRCEVLVTSQADVVVVGGGLAGLSAAVNVHRAGLTGIACEAGDPVGGRPVEDRAGLTDVANRRLEWC